MKLENNILKNMENKDFAVFILTHGRPDNIKTLNTLKKCGYTGKIYFIVDNEDKTVEQYQKNFGIENVKIFNKKAMADEVDEGNNFDERRTITHARNASFKIAKEIGITYFLQLDDDYNDFQYKLIMENEIEIRKSVKNLNKLFYLVLEYYKTINCKSIAFAQEGDFLGGISNGINSYRFSKRKCMNSFFCSTEKQFQFIGAMNEDVNTYTTNGSRGSLFLTIAPIALNQAATQSQKNGITDMYKRFGTYCKAFTTVMMQPSSVRVSMMNSTHQRIHHSINWITTTPMIINVKHKK
jgi:hypothetical protein